MPEATMLVGCVTEKFSPHNTEAFARMGLAPLLMKPKLKKSSARELPTMVALYEPRADANPDDVDSDKKACEKGGDAIDPDP